MNIGNIIKGNLNEFFGLNKDISGERLKICKKCPLYSSKFNRLVCNSNLYINPSTNEVSSSPKEGFIRGCGCFIKSKTTLLNETCPAGKW